MALASDLDKGPAKRISFATMPTAPDPHNSDRVLPGAGAKALFASIANDQSLTTGSGKKSAAPSATPTTQAVDPSRIAVTIENDSTVRSRASELGTALTDKGFSQGTTTANAPAAAATTTLTYGAGQKPEAQAVADALGLPSSHLSQGSADGLTLVVGGDWPSGTSYPSDNGGAGTSSPTDTHAAVSDAHARTADQSKSCAQVSPYKTVSLDGVGMTPAQAYAAARDQPDSDA